MIGWTSMKKVILLLLTTFVAIVPIACEDSTLIINCNKCFESLSDKMSLEIKLTIDSQNSFVPITFYRGNIDEGEILLRDTSYFSIYNTPKVEFNQVYSAVAKYSKGGRVIFVVDGRVLKKKLDKNSCSNPCYVIQGDVLDLRLK